MQSEKLHSAIKTTLSTVVILSTLATATALASDSKAQKETARKITPIIMMLMAESDPLLTFGDANDVVLSNNGRPQDVIARFNPTQDGLLITFDVDQLEEGQTLQVRINDNLIAEITANGEHQFTVPNGFLNSDSENIIEFISDPADALWEVNNLSLLNAEGPHTRAEAVRFLNKATFGASEASISHLLSLGYEAWLDEQLNATPTLHTPFYLEAIDERAAVGISGASQLCAAKMDSWWNGAIKGNDQVRQRMAFALSQIFVVGDTGCDTQFRHGFTAFYDLLIDNSFGSYRELLGDVTVNYTMGGWLSLRGSNTNPVYGNSADENYAREVMQLFSIGVFELNIDGSQKLENGKPIETYDNEIITNTARALTGWQRNDVEYSFYDMVLHPMIPWGGVVEGARWHDSDAKTLLNGVKVPAGGNVIEDTNIVLDTIAAHDNVAPFISKQLIQRFVTSNPSPSYIARVAEIFNDNGDGVKGDLGAVVKAILLDSEALNSHTNSNSGKMKEPLIMVSQVWRAFDAQSPIKYVRFMHTDRDLGQRPMGADTVFNFYRPDYSPTGELSEKGLVAPEIFLLNDSQLLTMFPKLQDVLSSQVNVDEEDIIDGKYNASFNLNLYLDLTTAKSLATNTPALMNYFDELMFGGLMSDGLRSLVSDYLDVEVVYDNDVGTDEWRERKVEEALSLLGVSPEFMVQQ